MTSKTTKTSKTTNKFSPEVRERAVRIWRPSAHNGHQPSA